jgi:hypothetical protein
MKLAPRYGVRGILGLVLLAVVIGFATGAHVTVWWQLALLWGFGVLIPLELIRVDAIEQAILRSAQHVRNGGRR